MLKLDSSNEGVDLPTDSVVLRQVVMAVSLAVAGLMPKEGAAEEVRESTIGFVARACPDHDFDKKVWERYLHEGTKNQFRELTAISSSLKAELAGKGKFFIIVGTNSCAACSIAKEWWEKVGLGGFKPIHLTTSKDGELADFDRNTADLEKLFGKGIFDRRELPIALLVENGKLLRVFSTGLCNVTNADNGPAVFLNRREGKLQ